MSSRVFPEVEYCRRVTVRARVDGPVVLAVDAMPCNSQVELHEAAGGLDD